jgi:hypothetical protein
LGLVKYNYIIHINFTGEGVALGIYICHLPGQPCMYVDAIKS